MTVCDASVAGRQTMGIMALHGAWLVLQQKEPPNVPHSSTCINKSISTWVEGTLLHRTSGHMNCRSSAGNVLSRAIASHNTMPTRGTPFRTNCCVKSSSPCQAPIFESTKSSAHSGKCRKCRLLNDHIPRLQLVQCTGTSHLSAHSTHGCNLSWECCPCPYSLCPVSRHCCAILLGSPAVTAPPSNICGCPAQHLRKNEGVSLPCGNCAWCCCSPHKRLSHCTPACCWLINPAKNKAAELRSRPSVIAGRAGTADGCLRWLWRRTALTAHRVRETLKARACRRG